MPALEASPTWLAKVERPHAVRLYVSARLYGTYPYRTVKETHVFVPNARLPLTRAADHWFHLLIGREFMG